MATKVGKAEVNHHEKPTVPQPATTADPGKIIIIGGGIAGLSCGCYLQMNGLQTEILEAAALPGGLCMAWHRGPYVFDGCLRWLIGARPPSAFHQIWQELGAIAGREILTHDEVLRVEGANGETLVVPTDLDKLSREFKRIAPEDAALIDQLVRAARRCAPLEPPLDKPRGADDPAREDEDGAPLPPDGARHPEMEESDAPHLSGALPERVPPRRADGYRRQRAYVGPGAGNGASVPNPPEHRLRRWRLAGPLRRRSRTVTLVSAAPCAIKPGWFQ